MIYKAPLSTNEFSSVILDNSQVKYKIYAGGTDLMPRWEQNVGLKPDVLIDIKKISDLFGIRENEDEIIIGALTTVQEIKNSTLIQRHFTALSEAARQFAGVQIRHRATIGGNICNASPAGDLLPCLVACQAEVQLTGPDGTRVLPISEFIVGPGETVLKPSEILSEIRLIKSGDSSIFFKLGLRRSMAIAVVNFAIVYTKNANTAFKSLAVAAGSVAPVIVSLTHFTDAIMNGTSLDKAIPLVDKDISPIDDIRATANYRRTVIKNILKNTFEEIDVR